MHGVTQFTRRSFLARAAGVVGGATLVATGITFFTQNSVSAGAGWKPGEVIAVNTDALNLRADATVDSDILATYPYGTQGTVITSAQSAGRIWAQVQITDDGNTGWFASEYLTAISGTPGGGNSSSSVTVVSGPLNLRQDPGLDGAILAVYDAGATGKSNGTTIDKDGYTWIQVQMNDGNSGYFAIEFVSIDGIGAGGDGGGDSQSTFTVTDGPLNLRSEAGLSGAILSTYPTGSTGVALTQESVQADGYMWALMQMDSDGQQGWLALDFVSFN